MKTAQQIVEKIEGLLAEIRAESYGDPAHIAAFAIGFLAEEIEELQQELWDIES